MYNQFIEIGTIKSIEILREGENPKGIITLSVVRDFKNSTGEYEHDDLPIEINNVLCDIIEDHFEEKMKIGVKGRILLRNNQIVLIGERFISL